MLQNVCMITVASVQRVCRKLWKQRSMLWYTPLTGNDVCGTETGDTLTAGRCALDSLAQDASPLLPPPHITAHAQTPSRSSHMLAGRCTSYLYISYSPPHNTAHAQPPFPLSCFFFEYKTQSWHMQDIHTYQAT